MDFKLHYKSGSIILWTHATFVLCVVVPLKCMQLKWKSNTGELKFIIKLANRVSYFRLHKNNSQSFFSFPAVKDDWRSWIHNLSVWLTTSEQCFKHLIHGHQVTLYHSFPWAHGTWWRAVTSWEHAGVESGERRSYKHIVAPGCTSTPPPTRISTLGVTTIKTGSHAILHSRW